MKSPYKTYKMSQKMKRKNTGRHKADPYQADPSEDLSHRPVMVGMQKMDCFFSCSLIYATYYTYHNLLFIYNSCTILMEIHWETG